MRRLVIIAITLIAAGIIICFTSCYAVGFDIKKLSASPEPTLVEKSFPMDQVKRIEVGLATEKLRVYESEDDEIHVSYYTNGDDYELKLEEGELSLKHKGLGFFDMFKFDLFFGNREATLRVPADFNADMEINLSTGDLTVENLQALGNLELELTTGRTAVRNVSCATLAIGSTTGEVSIADTKADKASVKCTTGAAHLSNLDAIDIYISMTTGSVRGTLAGNDSDYTIVSYTATGRNNLPANWGSGERKLHVEASTGDIAIDFAG